MGHRFDSDFVAGLPEGVDPCGGNDEFHTFVEWAPGWENRVEVEPTRTIEVYDFAFAEIEAADGSAPSRIDPFSHFARLDRVRRHVDLHIAEDLKAGVVARVAAMSRTGFSRYFREHVGMTFAGGWRTAGSNAPASSCARTTTR